MNAFEAYWNTVEEAVSAQSLDVFVPRKVIAGNAWKAVLEKILKMITDCPNEGGLDIIDVYNFIKKELNNE